jgi:hypothetical protein
MTTRTRPASTAAKLGLAAIVAAPVALVATAVPAAQANPLEAHCGTETGNTSIQGFIDHRQLGRELASIEKNSRGRVEVDVAGYTNRGREIWTARVGDGDTVVLVQGQIHGNEKHGTTAALNVLRTVAGNSPRAAEIRDEVTIVMIPMMNADGATLDRRQNDMTWDETVAAFPQLQDASGPAWNWNSRVGGYDLNRDFNPDLDYVPDPADFPGNSASVGWYVTPEAQTVRDVYRGLEDEFGVVDVFVDLHNQGPCYTGEGMDSYSTLSISGRFISDPAQHGDWPHFDYDASRRVNVAVYDAVQRGGSPHGAVTLYPQNINLPGTALGSFALRGSATILFETIGQTQSMGQKKLGMLIAQVEAGLTGIVDVLADGTFDDIDPERYELIPERRNVPQN